MAEVEWCDPPDVPTRGPNRPWAIIAAELKSRPGEWGLIDKTSDFVLGSRIQRGVSWWGPPGSFATTRRNIDGVVYTWAKYVGGG